MTGDDCYVMRAHVRDVEHLEQVIDRFAVLRPDHDLDHAVVAGAGPADRPQLTVSVPFMPAALWPSTGQ